LFALEHALDFRFVLLGEDGVAFEFRSGAIAHGENGLTLSLGSAIEKGVGGALADHILEAARGFQIAGEDQGHRAAAVDDEMEQEGGKPSGGADVGDGTPGNRPFANEEFAVGEFDDGTEAEPKQNESGGEEERSGKDGGGPAPTGVGAHEAQQDCNDRHVNEMLGGSEASHREVPT
jgi:hypothetical protein